MAFTVLGDRLASTEAPLDVFIPRPEVRARHEITIRAPAESVWAVCSEFDLQSIPLVRATFWLRSKVMGASTTDRWRSEGLLKDLRGMGWGALREEPPHLFVAGAACQPWLADVEFTPLGPSEFRGFETPERVKIAWTLEIEALEEERSRLATETRVVATDDAARRRFRRYWRWARFGIVGIRWFLLPAIRHEAERFQGSVGDEGAQG